MFNRFKTLLTTLALLCIPTIAMAAEEAPAIDTGDTTFILLSAALVMIMIPGVAFFYGGMVRQKNVLNTLMQVFMVLAAVSVQWSLLGYSLSFGSDVGGFIGGMDHAFLNGVGQEAKGTIPHYAFAVFQLMFAVITPALIVGSIVERMRFPAFILFIVAWATIVYDPLAHMVWGGGWLAKMGALDFAGGTVVHISSGVSGLVAALMLGKRTAATEKLEPHHMPMTVLGATLLWFGWFGFNAGSALAANGLAASAFYVTHLAAATASMAWIFAEWLSTGKPSMLGMVSGAVAGLVAITPAAGYVTPMAALAIGAAGGGVCYFAVAYLKAKLGYDDTLDAFGIHGIGGICGALLTGVFATKTVNDAGADGLLYGNPEQLYIQAVAVGAAILLAVVGTFVIIKVVGMITKVRASTEEEILGMDTAMHGEKAYADIPLIPSTEQINFKN